MTSADNGFRLAESGIVLTPSDPQILQTLGDWLMARLPDGYTVLQGQQNNVAAPTSPFATMTLINRKRLATNGRVYNPDQTVTVTQSLKLSVQIQCFGAGAGEAIAQVQTLWRDPDACDWFRAHLPSCAPLFASELVEQPFTTAENQYEECWRVYLELNALQSLTLPSQSALSARTSLVQADRYPQPKVNP